jgi:hypothetical protein
MNTLTGSLTQSRNSTGQVIYLTRSQADSRMGPVERDVSSIRATVVHALPMHPFFRGASSETNS